MKNNNKHKQTGQQTNSIKQPDTANKQEQIANRHLQNVAARLWTDPEGASAECFALRCGTSESSVAKNVRLSWIASSCPIQLQLGSLQEAQRGVARESTATVIMICRRVVTTVVVRLVICCGAVWCSMTYRCKKTSGTKTHRNMCLRTTKSGAGEQFLLPDCGKTRFSHRQPIA